MGDYDLNRFWRQFMVTPRSGDVEADQELFKKTLDILARKDAPRQTTQGIDCYGIDYDARLDACEIYCPYMAACKHITEKVPNFAQRPPVEGKIGMLTEKVLPELAAAVTEKKPKEKTMGRKPKAAAAETVTAEAPVGAKKSKVYKFVGEADDHELHQHLATLESFKPIDVANWYLDNYEIEVEAAKGYAKQAMNALIENGLLQAL